ncbi:MAG: hypothetical protein QXH27_00640 [Candidatus Micrarchaeia archaeon]
MFARKNVFGFDFTRKNILALLFLAVLPNLFGWLVLPSTPWGGKFHVFQITIFLAAALFGWFGGAAAGVFGAVGTALALNNPWILAGNAILGGVTGFLHTRRSMRLLYAVLIAYAVQLPWLYWSDVYLARMPVPVVQSIVVALFVSNLVMALAAEAILPLIRRGLHFQ